jgi:hypothetical protein
MKRITFLIRGEDNLLPPLIRGNKEGVLNNSSLAKGDKGGCKRTKETVPNKSECQKSVGEEKINEALKLRPKHFCLKSFDDTKN